MIESTVKLVLRVWAVALALSVTGQLPHATYALGKLALFAYGHQMSLGAFNRGLTGSVPSHHRLHSPHQATGSKK